ncbi:hypothetical protein B5S32_g3615 [[Candida] boidinii]|nr:hypothetical protein B5S32_g3615 [[Candida] boidinii]
MSSIAKNIVVFGGNGFLGKRICQEALSRGYLVTSISSSGSPPKQLAPMDYKWVQKVNWTKGDIFKPETYRDKLYDCTSVVHTIGILLENQSYKNIVRSNDDALGEILSFFKTDNPMNKNSFNTYQKINTESCIVLAETLIDIIKEKNNNNNNNNNNNELLSSQINHFPFAYISADKKFPGIPSGYIESKRTTELELYSLQPLLRPVFLRPGFMYDIESTEADFRSKFKSLLNGMNLINNKLLNNSLSDLIRPTVSTQTVAKWCIDKIEDQEFHGPVSLDEMTGKS